MERQEPDRRAIGREEFVEKVWAWKAESGGTIINQLKRLGASCDWSRERFTMDEGLSRAVLKVFVELYRAGPDLPGQAAGQLGPEAPDRDLRPRGRAGRDQGQALAFPLSDRGRAGPLHRRRDDAAGDDAGRHRRRGPSGRRALQGPRRQDTRSCRWSAGGIPIVADEYADPETGTGAVKITPAHDFNDFEVGKRHELPAINILDVEGDDRASRATTDFLEGVDRRAPMRRGTIWSAVARPRPLRGAQARRRDDGGGRLPREDRGPRPRGAAWRPRRRADRAVS